MILTESIDIDTIALNWMPPVCQGIFQSQEPRIDDACKASEEVGRKLVHSFDMSWDGYSVYWDTIHMARVLWRHAGSEVAYRCESRHLRNLPSNTTSVTDYADLRAMKTYVDGQDHSHGVCLPDTLSRAAKMESDLGLLWCSGGSMEIHRSGMLEDVVSLRLMSLEDPS
jgi:hypothetical protein